MTIGTFAYSFDGATGKVIKLRFVPTGYVPLAGEYTQNADKLPSINGVDVRDFTDWYFIVNDTNPTTQVYSTASGAYVANTVAPFATWLSANSNNVQPPGSAFPIHGMANNGSGLIRLTLGTTAALQTGQKFNVGGQTGQAAASGNWVITVVDGTHVDLQGSTFNAGDPWISGGVLQGASIIDTDANLRIKINKATFPVITATSFVPASGSASSSSNLTLTNPLPSYNSIHLTGTAHKVILPAMNSPNSPSLGYQFVIENSSTAGWISGSTEFFGVYANDGTTLLVFIEPTETYQFTLTNNSTQNGSFKFQQIGARIELSGATNITAANNASVPTTSIDINFVEASFYDAKGSSLLVLGGQRTNSISLSGPAADGRDQAAAFNAGDTIFFYGIAAPGTSWSTLSSKGDPRNYTPPTLPAGFTHYCYLFSAVLDGSGLLTTIRLGEAYAEGGYLTIASAATTNLDTPVFRHYEITGTTTITAFTIAAGKIRSVRFAGILTLTNGANLVLPTAANITTAAGDFALVQGVDGTVARVLAYFRADGTTLAGASIANDAATAVKIAASGHGYAGGMVNGTLTVSAAASALTIALKTQAGTDPSATDPVDFFFRNATGTTGDYTRIRVTAATSFVISSGSTMGVTSATAFRIWIVGFNDAGTFRLGAINCSTSAQIFPLIEGLASSTAEGGAGAADSAGVIYTGTAVTSKAMLILGYAEWNTSGLTAGTWTTTNLSRVQLFGAGIKKPGDVVQKVINTVVRTDTTTSATYIATGFSTTITPNSAANLLEIVSTGPGYCNSVGGAAANASFELSRGTTNNTNMIGSVTVVSAAANQLAQGAIYCLAYDLPNTVSAQAYAQQFNNNNSTTTGWGNANNVTMIITELMG